jgi:hypothetical protein
MTTKKRTSINIAKILGASKEIKLKHKATGGPLDWLTLAHTVQSCLISRGGRPSNPQWDTKRLVPFSTETWKHLLQKKKDIGAQGRKVGPAQLAAIMIEKYLSGKIGEFYIVGWGNTLSSSTNEPRYKKQTFFPLSLHINDVKIEQESENTKYYNFSR